VRTSTSRLLQDLARAICINEDLTKILSNWEWDDHAFQNPRHFQPCQLSYKASDSTSTTARTRQSIAVTLSTKFSSSSNMRISPFQPCNAVCENVIFKALAGPRKSDLHQRGFDQIPVMVALRRSSPSTDFRLTSTQELEDYLIETLEVKRAPSASTSSRSFVGDVPQTMEAATFRPDDWIVFGKTLRRPSSHGGRDAGYSKPSPQGTLHAGLYSCGMVGQNKTCDVSSKMGREHPWSNRVGVPKPIFKNQKRGGKFCNGYRYKNGTVTLRFLKNPPKTHSKATESTSNPKGMEEFLQFLNKINIEENTQPENQETDNRVRNMKDLQNENMSLNRSVRIIVAHARVLRTYKAASVYTVTKCTPDLAQDDSLECLTIPRQLIRGIVCVQDLQP
jgi:hypothetical protein